MTCNCNLVWMSVLPPPACPTHVTSCNCPLLVDRGGMVIRRVHAVGCVNAR